MTTTADAKRSTKKTSSPARKEAAPAPQVVLPETPRATGVMKTVLVASYGWPTEEMQPSKRQASRR